MTSINHRYPLHRHPFLYYPMQNYPAGYQAWGDFYVYPYQSIFNRQIPFRPYWPVDVNLSARPITRVVQPTALKYVPTPSPAAKSNHFGPQFVPSSVAGGNNPGYNDGGAPIDPYRSPAMPPGLGYSGPGQPAIMPGSPGNVATPTYGAYGAQSAGAQSPTRRPLVVPGVWTERMWNQFTTYPRPVPGVGPLSAMEDDPFRLDYLPQTGAPIQSIPVQYANPADLAMALVEDPVLAMGSSVGKIRNIEPMTWVLLGLLTAVGAIFYTQQRRK